MIRLAKPEISEKAIAAVGDVLRSGNLVQGQHVVEFEEKLANYLNVKNVIVVSSGTAALHLSLIALDIKRGDEVIIPAFTFPATANVVELVGAKPIFVDINLSDFCIDTSKIEAAITERTKAIMPVHEFGQAAKMDDIVSICKRHNLKLVEDAACALGTEFNKQKVGTFGEFGCFSFHPRKAITTGEGGVIVTNDDDLAAKTRTLRNHGMVMQNGKFEFIDVGYNYRLTDFQAVLGSSQLIDFDAQIEKRRKIAKEYDMLLTDINWIKTPEVFKERKMTFQTYHILVSSDVNRTYLIKYLFDNKIQSNFGAHSVIQQDYFKRKYNLEIDLFSNSNYSYNNGLALPLGNHINSNVIQKIISVLKEAY